MLDKKMLMDMPAGTIFATGKGIFPKIEAGVCIRWIACRGKEYHDWTIYYHMDGNTLDYVTRHGHKLHTKDKIKELVSCDEEAMELYRF